MCPRRAAPTSRNSFASIYRNLYAHLGVTLTARHGTSKSRLTVAEKKLQLRLPRSLREYYLVAGRERKFNQAFYHLRKPEEWQVLDDHLLFMDENQEVVSWGIPVTKRPGTDSAVFVCVNGEPAEWYPEQEACSTFLCAMLVWQATFSNAMSYTASADVVRSLVRKLDKSWPFIGEVNKMRAYCRPGQVACFVKWGDRWCLFAGATSKLQLAAIAAELKIQWRAER